MDDINKQLMNKLIEAEETREKYDAIQEEAGVNKALDNFEALKDAHPKLCGYVPDFITEEYNGMAKHLRRCVGLCANLPESLALVGYEYLKALLMMNIISCDQVIKSIESKKPETETSEVK